MKTRFSLLGLALFLAINAFGAGDADLSAEAQRAYMRGDFELAKAKFEGILQADPSNRTAISYLKMIKSRGESGGVTMEKQLRAVTLEKVALNEADFGSALEFLKAKAAEAKVSVSFVVQPGVNRDQKVTLNLENIPFLEALRYLCNLGGASFVVEKHAVLIRPAAAQAQ